MHTQLVVALGVREGVIHSGSAKVEYRIRKAVAVGRALPNVVYGIMAAVSGRARMLDIYRSYGIREEDVVFPDNDQCPPTMTTLDELRAAFLTAQRLRAILVIVTSVHHIPRVLYLCSHQLREYYEPRVRHDQLRIVAADPALWQLFGHEAFDVGMEVPRLVREKWRYRQHRTARGVR